MNSFLLGIRSPTENIDKASPLPKAPRGLVLAHKRQHGSSVQDSVGRAIGAEWYPGVGSFMMSALQWKNIKTGWRVSLRGLPGRTMRVSVTVAAWRPVSGFRKGQMESTKLVRKHVGLCLNRSITAISGLQCFSWSQDPRHSLQKARKQNRATYNIKEPRNHTIACTSASAEAKNGLSSTPNVTAAETAMVAASVCRIWLENGHPLLKKMFNVQLREFMVSVSGKNSSYWQQRALLLCLTKHETSMQLHLNMESMAFSSMKLWLRCVHSVRTSFKRGNIALGLQITLKEPIPNSRDLGDKLQKDLPLQNWCILPPELAESFLEKGSICVPHLPGCLWAQRQADGLQWAIPLPGSGQEKGDRGQNTNQYMIPVRCSLPPPPWYGPKTCVLQHSHENAEFALFFARWVAAMVRKPGNS